jgi:hypothetical protein
MSSIEDDDLALLWRASTAPEPDPREIARLAGRASMRRFDRDIFRRNSLEYLAGVVAIVFFGWQIVTGNGVDRLQSVAAVLCVSFVLGHLWWSHRNLTPLDPSADARSYQVAMLERIDEQIRLLDSNRFWYLMPLSIPIFWPILAGSSLVTVTDAAMLLGLFAGAAWLNERWGVRRLKKERAYVEGLFQPET